jgi:uncharacterized membrane protein YgdD (TMEM256/DUF423 family)
MHKNRIYVRTAAIMGGLAVILGAFGSHFLGDMLKPEQLSAYQTGVQYQFYHVFALFVVGLLYKRYHNDNLKKAANFFVLGTVVFSGSLYASTALKAAGMEGLGKFSFVTPIGGLILILGWIYLLLGVPSNRPDSEAD